MTNDQISGEFQLRKSNLEMRINVCISSRLGFVRLTPFISAPKGRKAAFSLHVNYTIPLSWILARASLYLVRQAGVWPFDRLPQLDPY